MNKDTYEFIGRMIVDEEVKRQMAEAIGQQIAENLVRKNGQQSTATASEQSARMEQLKTQGRKGCKALRINMAFTPENHKYLKRHARKNGMTITEFCNQIITRDRLMREEKE